MLLGLIIVASVGITVNSLNEQYPEKAAPTPYVAEAPAKTESN